MVTVKAPRYHEKKGITAFPILNFSPGRLARLTVFGPSGPVVLYDGFLMNQCLPVHIPSKSVRFLDLI